MNKQQTLPGLEKEVTGKTKELSEDKIITKQRSFNPQELKPGSGLDDLVMRLKKGFVISTSYDVWTTFREINGLPLDPKTSPPIIGDLKDQDPHQFWGERGVDY